MHRKRFPRQDFKAKHAKLVRAIFAIAVAIMGLLSGLTTLLPLRPGRLDLLTALLYQFAPFSPSIWSFLRTGHTIALIVGFFLFLLAFGLAHGKRRAWQLVIILLPLAALAHVIKGLNVEEAGLTLLLWFGLLGGSHYFHVESDPWRMRQAILLLTLGFLLLLLYGLSGLYLLQAQLLLPNTIQGILRSLLLRFINISAGEIIPLTRRATWFLDSLPWLSTAALLTGLFFLLRPVSAHWWKVYQKERFTQMRQNITQLVRDYGNHTLAFFALAPENLHYLTLNGEGLVSYRLTGNVAVVLGDPICPPDVFEHVTRNFLDLCELHDWRVAFYQAHPEHLPRYHALGLHAFKLGEEAILNPQTFTLSGSAMANVRTSCRRAERDGVIIQWYDGVPPKEVLDQLQSLSQAWLERKGGKHTTEMGFSMGRFDELVETATRAKLVAETYSPQADGCPKEVPRFVTGVAIDQSSHVCAFITFTPLYGSQTHLSQATRQGSTREWGWALDLMRRGLQAPPGDRPALPRSDARFPAPPRP